MNTSQKRALAGLSASIQTRDADELESALDEALGAGLDLAIVPILLDLLPQRWHHRHEDVASALQRLKAPQAVSVLTATALSDVPYSGYDYSLELARKCCWALADIGTPEARRALQRVSEGGNETVAGYAVKRLKNWERESARKGRG